jgi:hypothetical protein
VNPIKNPIQAKAPLQFVRKLFRELNTILYGKPIKDCFIDFLHAYFECFKNSEWKTTKNHFNEYKSYNSFENAHESVKKTIK